MGKLKVREGRGYLPGHTFIETEENYDRDTTCEQDISGRQ